MKATSQSIIQSFFYICKSTNRGYVYISQERMLEILRTYYHTDICRRTLNYYLRELEDGNYIRRIRRHRRGENNQILFHTSINALQKKALQYLARLAYWFKKVGWKVRCAPAENLINKMQYQKEMNEAYRRHVFNTS